MLPSVTKKYYDCSTNEYFKFTFFCDTCGLQWQSERYPFSLNAMNPQTECEKTAHGIMWKVEHDAAYERANMEAIMHFNRCPECGKRVCDDCFSVFDDICIECEKIE